MYQAVLDVIGDIYEASFRPEHWEEALKKVCRLVNARSAGLFIKTYDKKRTIVMYGYGIPKAVLFAYNHGFSSLDPSFKIMLAEAVGKGRNIVNPDEPGFSHGVFHSLVNKPGGIYYIGGMNVFNDSSWQVGLGVHRNKQMGLFEPGTLAVLEELQPHLQRALRIQQEFTRLRLHERALSEGMSRLALGMILLDENGLPTYINPVAQAILESHPAIEMTSKGISAYSPEQRKILRKAILDLADSGNASGSSAAITIGLKHPERKTPLTLMLAPYRNIDMDLATLASEARVLIYVTDPEEKAGVSIDILNQLYGLSEAEALVAIGIVNGLTMEQISEANHVTMNTVKTQLKSVFRKTNSSRQAELVRLLLKQPGMILPSEVENSPEHP